MAAAAAQQQEEDFQVECAGPLIGVVLSIIGYYCYYYWERIPDVGLLESVVVPIGLALLVILMLNIPKILQKMFDNKLYASLVIILLFPTIFVISKPTWKLFVYFNGTTISNITDEEPSIKVIPTAKVMEPAHTPVGQDHTSDNNDDLVSQSFQALKAVLSERDETTSESQTVTSDYSVNKMPTFEGDCTKYSKLLLSNTVLTSPRLYHIKGQVEMFKRTVHLTGRPSILALVKEPNEYSATAMDILGDRHHNTEAHSHESAQDAVEKALIKICETFQTKGFHVS